MKLQGLNCGVAVNGMQAERMAREKEEEDEFRRQTMERFAEQDRLEQMNAQKRRIKVAQHAREVERLIQEKRAMFEAAMVSTLSLVKASVNVLVKGFYPDMGFRCSPYIHIHKPSSTKLQHAGSHACVLRHSRQHAAPPCLAVNRSNFAPLSLLNELHYTKHAPQGRPLLGDTA